MKKIFYILMLFTFIIISGCGKKISTTDEVLKFVEEKGKENIDWNDFEHLVHKDIGSGFIIEEYSLKDDNYLLLIGTTYEEKPESIRICDSNNKIVKELK